MLEILILISIKAHAFKEISKGIHAPGAQLELMVNPSGFNLLSSGEVLAITKTAGETWSNVSDSNFVYKIPGTTSSTVQSYVIMMAGAWGYGSNVVAVTSVSSSGGVINNVYMEYNPAFNYKNNAALPAGTGQDKDLQMIMTHEMGHALGLDHFGDGNSVMAAPSVRNNIRALGVEDYWAVSIMYPRNEVFPFATISCGSISNSTDSFNSKILYYMLLGLPLMLLIRLKRCQLRNSVKR